MARKRSLALCLLALMLLVSTLPTAAAKINLKFAMWLSAGGPTELAGQQELLNKYMAMNPDVEIELITVASNYAEKWLTMAAGGIAPDIMVVSRIWLPTFVEQGIVQPIDQWLNKEPIEFRRNIIELTSGTYNKKVYGIPIWGGPVVLEYNADKFDAVGFASPISMAKQKTWTWDAFVSAGKKITHDSNGDGTTDVFMHAKLGTRQADWYIKMRSFGVDLFTSNGKASNDVNAVEKVLTFWQEMAWRHHITPVGKESSNFTKGTETAYFAWISDVPNHYKNIKNQFRVELVSPPAGPAGSYTIAGGCPLTISSTTPNAYEAYKFAKWYAMESEHWKLRGVPPGWDDMKRDYRSYLATMYSWPDVVAELMSGNNSMEPGLGEPGLGKYYDELNKGWNEPLAAVANNTISPREGAMRLVEHTKKVLQGNN